MSDTDRLYRLLKREGSRGVHTHDLRREGISGNPSQRATDVEQKYGVEVERPREFRGGRNGSRFKLQEQCGVTSRRTTNTRGLEDNPDSHRAAACGSQPLDMTDQGASNCRVTRAEVPAAAPEALFPGYEIREAM